MRAVLSTVSRAQVSVGGEVVGSIGSPGLLALIGVGAQDADDAAATMARKIADLRLFPAPGRSWTDGPRNHSAVDVGAEILVVSQFTLMGATAKGRRPSWGAAAPGPQAEPVIEDIVAYLRARGLQVSTGKFGANMTVESTNEGPFTVIVDT